MYWNIRKGTVAARVVAGRRRRRLAIEHLEDRRLLSLSALSDDPGFLAPPESQEYLAALIRFRESVGWTVEEPRLENGYWYLGPVGDVTNPTILFNVNAAETTNTDQLYDGGGLGLGLTGNGMGVTGVPLCADLKGKLFQ